MGMLVACRWKGSPHHCGGGHRFKGRASLAAELAGLKGSRRAATAGCTVLAQAAEQDCVFGVSLSTEAVDNSVDEAHVQRAISPQDCIFITLVKK
jgi:hypothetical protein